LLIRPRGGITLIDQKASDDGGTRWGRTRLIRAALRQHRWPYPAPSHHAARHMAASAANGTNAARVQSREPFPPHQLSRLRRCTCEHGFHLAADTDREVVRIIVHIGPLQPLASGDAGHELYIMSKAQG